MATGMPAPIISRKTILKSPLDISVRSVCVSQFGLFQDSGTAIPVA